MREAFEKSDDDNQVTVCIDVGNDGKAQERLDAFLSRNIAIMSRSALSRIIKADCVTLNGKTPKPASKLKSGDQIIVKIPPPPSTDVLPEEIPLDILYEDKDIVLVNKQASTPVPIDIHLPFKVSVFSTLRGFSCFG